MINNDQIILDKVLDQECLNRGLNTPRSAFFDQFVSEQELKDFDLSSEELELGSVGGGGDGGIDAIYTFANGELVLDDFDSTSLKKNIEIEVVVIQSKTSDSFAEDPVHRLISVTNDLFNLANNIDAFDQAYNDGVRSAVTLFRETYKELAAKFPSLKFRYVYATRGDSKSVHPNVLRKAADDLRKTVERLFSSAKYEFHFRGASELLEMARRQPISSYNLIVTESISASGGYIALVPLNELYRLLCDENRRLRRGLFEANVRDYQGSTQVNGDIRNTLEHSGAEDFWWLNNGITIVAAKAIQSGKTLTIENPQIVNGLQTSREIFNYFSTAPSTQELRCVMIRVIAADNNESRDKIIKATNSQTALPSASLRATDKIHRDIEEYLKPYGFYYDRQKNCHKNNGKPTEQIVGIPALAQSIMAIVLQRPDHARARPSTLMKKDEEYRSLFNPDYPIEIYLLACKLMKKTHAFLKLRGDLSQNHRTNLLFYVITHAAACLAERPRPTPKQLAQISIDKIDDAIIEQSYLMVKIFYDLLGASDQIAKGTQFTEKLREDLASKFPSKGHSILGELGTWTQRKNGK